MTSQQMQITLNASPERILRAWTDELAVWFAEHADVSIDEQRYDFWGRYTPETPDREAGRHPLIRYEAGKGFTFRWRLEGEDNDVDVSIHPRGEAHVIVLRRSSGSYEDFWFLSLENLRRHLNGKLPVRCDYSQPMVGDIEQSIEIDAPPEAVYEALINPEQLERWMASNATVEPRVGGVYDIGWQGVRMEILELVPNERLKILETGEQSQGMIVTWTLEGSGGKTRLTLVHSGFAPDQASGLNTGWLNYMSWIKSLVEEGESWQPTILRLNPDFAWFYPASMGRAQSELIAE